MAFPRSWWVLGVAALLASVAGFVLLPTMRSSAQVQEGATMTVLRGQVAVVHPDGSAIQPAPSGTVVNPGDEIRTLGSTSALITFFIGTEIELDQNTTIAIEQVSKQGDRIDVALKQAFGATVNRVQTLAGSGSVYRIDAGGAVALVRGTTFVLIGPITTSSGTDVVILVCGADCTAVSTFAGCPLAPFLGYGVLVDKGQVVSPCMTFAVSRTADLTSAAFEAITTIEQQVQGDTNGVPAGQVQSGQQQEIETRGRRRPEDDQPPQVSIVPSPGAVPTVSIQDATANEGTGVTFTVVLSAPSNQPVTVFYATVNGTAIAPVDYTAASGSIVIPPGATTGTIVIQTVADGTGPAAIASPVPSGSVVSRGTVTAAAVEPPETFFVVLTGATGATIGDGQGQGTIVDPGSISLSINDVTAAEGGNATFTVSLSAASSQPITVTYSTADGTAIAPGDYTATTNGTLTIPANATSGQIVVTTVADAIVEPAETFVVNLAGATGATNLTIPDPQGLGTILDTGTLTLSINDPPAATEGAVVNFTVSLSAASSQPVTVDFATTSVGATNPATAGACATAGVDYAAQSGTLTFPASSTTPQTISIVTCGDALDELNETFFVTLSNPSANATILDSQGIGTINDDDLPPSLSINDATVNPEGTGTNGTATFTVSLSAASGLPITVNFATDTTGIVNPATGGAGCGTFGVDFISQSGTLTFPAGSTAPQTIAITTCGDAVDDVDESLSEPQETFFVNLSAAVNATVSDGQGLGTIVDDDTSAFSVAAPPPTLEGNDCSDSGTDGGPLVFPPCGTTDFDFIVTLSPPADHARQVWFETADGGSSTAAIGGPSGSCAFGSSDGGIDYETRSGVLTFAPGDVPKEVTVDVCADQAFFWDFDETDENFYMYLRLPPTPLGAIVSIAQATIIEDDDEDFGLE